MADYLINGDDCERCGMPFDEPGNGFPRVCTGCTKELFDAETSKMRKQKAADMKGASREDHV
jgi:hypothetical protein